MKEPIPGSHINSPDYLDVEARIYAERMKELTAGDKMTSREAAYIIAREDNEKAMKLQNSEREYVPFSERPLQGWQVREAAERESVASQPQRDQEPEKTLKFFEEREPQPNYALLREETARHSQSQEQPETAEQQHVPEAEPERSLKFFEDRQPSRPNYAQLREETAAHSESQEQPKVPANDGPVMEAPQGEQLATLNYKTPEQHQAQESDAPANDPEPTRPERTLTFHEDRHPLEPGRSR